MECRQCLGSGYVPSYYDWLKRLWSKQCHNCRGSGVEPTMRELERRHKWLRRFVRSTRKGGTHEQ